MCFWCFGICKSKYLRNQWIKREPYALLFRIITGGFYGFCVHVLRLWFSSSNFIPQSIFISHREDQTCRIRAADISKVKNRIIRKGFPRKKHLNWFSCSAGQNACHAPIFATWVFPLAKKNSLLRKTKNFFVFLLLDTSIIILQLWRQEMKLL